MDTEVVIQNNMWSFPEERWKAPCPKPENPQATTCCWSRNHLWVGSSLHKVQYQWKEQKQETNSKCSYVCSVQVLFNDKAKIKLIYYTNPPTHIKVNSTIEGRKNITLNVSDSDQHRNCTSVRACLFAL